MSQPPSFPQQLDALKAKLEAMAPDIQTIEEALAIDDKKAKLRALESQLEDPALWQQSEKLKQIGAQKAALSRLLGAFDSLQTAYQDCDALWELAKEGYQEQHDESLLSPLQTEVQTLTKQLEALWTQTLFRGRSDALPCYIEIQSGSGGTEAQDWAEMMLRMYSRFCEKLGFEFKLVEYSSGEVAGIKSATLHVQGHYPYGHLRTETGVHRLVRKSPFDSTGKRHTSFASVFVSPELDDQIEIEIDPAELRIDTYRSSGAGGQHVNKTDSAVRITHLPSGIVAQCQTERSQHQNKDRAFQQLRSKLYEIERLKQQARTDALEQSKTDISWGHQIRSYVLDQGRIKDLRTQEETGQTRAVLDGDLLPFIQAALKAGL